MGTNEVYLCYVTLVPEVPNNNFPPWISTYAIYHGQDKKEVLFPNDAKIKELCSGNVVIGHHPQGTLHREVRSTPIAIGEARSENTMLSFCPLSKVTIEEILEGKPSSAPL